jgi:hypothetical protein
MFPPIVRENLFNQDLGSIWAEMTVHIPESYQELLTSIFNGYIENPDNHKACRKYMDGVNAELLADGPLENILLNGTFHPRLLAIFYRRVLARLIAKFKNRKIKPASYVDLTDLETIPDGERGADILAAIKEEITEVTNVHLSLSANKTLHDLPVEDIKAYKHEATWFKDVNNDIFLEIVEIVVDYTDKGNSLAKKIDHYIPKTALDHRADDIKQGIAFGASQIIGIVVSVGYLLISIITPLYKKFKLNRPDPLINRWSMRYFIPSVLLFTLGMVAMTVPVVGLWSGLGFAAYSFGSNIFKVTIYFYYYYELKEEIRKNDAALARFAEQRIDLRQEIIRLKGIYKEYQLNNDTDAAKSCAATIQNLERQHEEATAGWLKAQAASDELAIKRIRTQDKFTGFLNIARLIVVHGALAGAILSVIPPLAMVGGIVLLTTLCLSTILVTAHYINKFILIREEKNKARQKKHEFMDALPQASSVAIMQRLHKRKHGEISPSSSEENLEAAGEAQNGAAKQHHDRQGKVRREFLSHVSRPNIETSNNPDEGPSTMNGYG